MIVIYYCYFLPHTIDIRIEILITIVCVIKWKRTLAKRSKINESRYYLYQ